MVDRSFYPLVCLDERIKYFGVVLGVGFLRLVGRSGGGEGVGGVLGLGQQVMMGLSVLFLGQLRGVAGCRGLGVSRCHGLGVVEAGSEVRYGYFAHLNLQIRGHLRPKARKCLHVGGGGMVGGVGGLERCPRERPGPEPEIARRERLPIGKAGAESKPAGAAEEPCPAGAEAVRRVVSAEVLVVDSGSDIVVRLGGARGCTTGEGDSQGRGEYRTKERAWQSVSCCCSVSRLGTRLNIRILAGEFFSSVD